MVLSNFLPEDYNSFEDALTRPSAGLSKPPPVSSMHTRFNTSCKRDIYIQIGNIFSPPLQSYDAYVDELLGAVISFCSLANTHFEKIFVPTTAEMVKSGYFIKLNKTDTLMYVCLHYL